MILTRAAEEKNGATAKENKNKGVGTTKKSGANKSLKRYSIIELIFSLRILWKYRQTPSPKVKENYCCFCCCLCHSVRKLSKMTEKISKAMLDGVGLATGSVMAPLVKSQTGKAFLAMVPGEVLLASLDAVSK